VSEQYPDEPVVVHDRRRIDPETGQVRTPGTGAQPAPGRGPAGAVRPGGIPGQAGGPGSAAGAGPAGSEGEVAALAEQLAERTSDLQRVTAEYANYRKRVERDRQTVVDVATGSVLAALLPVLDDVDRARQHGDLTGTFKAVADQLEATLEKLGLQPVGVPGDPFDPTVHEAVAHQVSPDVTEPTAVAVLRRGYRQGERLLRAPLVAVAEPAPAEPEPAEPEPAEPEADAETAPAGQVDTPAEPAEDR
jgi:molecular chaperone GrpE